MHYRQITYGVTLISSDHKNSSVIVDLAMGRYHVPQNVFLALKITYIANRIIQLIYCNNLFLTFSFLYG